MTCTRNGGLTTSSTAAPEKHIGRKDYPVKQPLITLVSTLVAAMSVGCNYPERSKPDPHISEQISPVNAALVTTSHLNTARSPGGSAVQTDATTIRNVLPPNPVTVGASLGRAFQGEIVAEVTTPNKKEPATLRYMASGGRMRMRLEGSSNDFDLIADGKTLSVLDHANRTFRVVDLSESSPEPAVKEPNANLMNELKVKENPDAVTSQAGVRCEEHLITGPQTQIQTCVAALPGAFEWPIFERATGIGIPAWLAILLDNEDLPLRAQGYYNNSKEFKSTVVRYAPEPLPEESFIIPSNYTKAK